GWKSPVCAPPRVMSPTTMAFRCAQCLSERLGGGEGLATGEDIDRLRCVVPGTGDDRVRPRLLERTVGTGEAASTAARTRARTMGSESSVAVEALASLSAVVRADDLRSRRSSLSATRLVIRASQAPRGASP